jgi:hypothetical protein
VTFTLQELNRQDATHKLSGSVSGARNKADISLHIDGNALKGFQYNPSTGAISAQLKLKPGTHNIVVTAQNDCGTDNQGSTITVEKPCSPPTVAFTLTEVNRQDASHELSGSVSGVKNKSEISLTIDGSANNGFQFIPSNGELNAKFKLAPGSHTIKVTANNACGTDAESAYVTVEEEEEEEDDDGGDDGDDDGDDDGNCGIRINPGNSDWQFCLVTPSGTYSREDLTNSNFSYSGSASSLFFMPIAGGGEATVNGNPYTIRSGQYYLFSGSLNVTVSTKNPGAMGHWSVCISASSTPVSGNGKNRPQSPCEVDNKENDKGNDNGKDNSNNDSKTKSTGNTNRSNVGSDNNRLNNRSNVNTDSRSNNRSNVNTNNKSNMGSGTNTRSNQGSKDISNKNVTKTNYRTNDKTINRTNTRTNIKTNDTSGSSAKKSSSARSINSTNRKTNTTKTNRSTEETEEKPAGRTIERSKR